MAAIVTNDIRVYNARQFVESLNEPANSSIYTFIGQPSFVAAQAAPDNVQLQYDIWDNMIALKRITGSDIKLGIRKIVWASGNVYNRYSHDDANLYTRNFYVINPNDNGVYKCLGNAAPGTVSTVAPSGASTTGNTALLADGYRWKYMYTVTSGDLAKFGTPSFIPYTDDSTVANAAIEGGILHIDVVSGGSGYGSAPTIAIQGDGSGAVAVANMSGGAIANVTMTAVGKNYRFANVLITGGGGTGAVLKAMISPVGGHGYDGAVELGAAYVILNQRIQTTDTAFPTGITYHQVGLVQDPFLYNTNTISYQSTLTNYRVLTGVTPPAQTAQGNVITQPNGANGYVLAKDASTISYLQPRNTSSNLTLSYTKFVGGQVATVVGLGSAGTVTAVSNADVRPNSGRILYVDTRAPITRTVNQSESISIILEF